jgi:uncharacterized protein (TIGR00106 family)
VLSDAGFKIQLHHNGTAIEGQWDWLYCALEACHREVHSIGCPRVYTMVKINTRTDKEQILEEKVASVQALLCSKTTRGRAAASGSDSGLPKRVPLIA